MALPSLSLQKFRHGTPEQRQKFIAGLQLSLMNHGFVKVIDHDINREEVQEMFEWNRKFFQISDEARRKCANTPGPRPQRGYSAVGEESAGALFKGLIGDDTKERRDVREHWDQGAATDSEFPNRWPDENELPGFRSFMEVSYVKFRNICSDVLSALELAFHLQPGSFTHKCEGNASEFRFNHYPAVEIEAIQKGNSSRIAPHFDLGVITLLFQDGIGGLEMEHRDGTRKNFVPVECTDPTEMVINISETMQRWTNGALKAGLHQVMVPTSMKAKETGIIQDRYSIAYFCKADREVLVGPLPEFVDEARPALYDNITALEYQNKRLLAAY